MVSIILIAEIISIAFIALSFVLLTMLLSKHFRGMKYPPYWIYFIGGFALLSLHNVFVTLVPQTGLGESVSLVLKIFSSFSMFLGSYEIYKKYESNISKKISERMNKNHNYAKTKQ